MILSVSLGKAADDFITLEGRQLCVDVIHSDINVLVSAQNSLIVSVFHSNTKAVDCLGVGDIGTRNSFICCLDWFHTDYLHGLVAFVLNRWDGDFLSFGVFNSEFILARKSGIHNSNLQNLGDGDAFLGVALDYCEKIFDFRLVELACWDGNGRICDWFDVVRLRVDGRDIG